jgi:capsular polysaccharide transport system permease protein
MADGSRPHLSSLTDSAVIVQRGQAEAEAGWRPAKSQSNLLRKWARAFNPWVWLFVFLPTLAAGIYYFGIAADLYASEAEFVVKTQTPEPSSLLGTLLQSTGLSRSEDDAFSVNAFIASRDAVRLLQQNDHLNEVFDRPEADFLTRFPSPIWGSSFEQLYKHYQDFVNVSYDSVTGVTKLQVKAYRSEDAQNIAKALLNYSEALVNRLNARSERDAVAFAESEVRSAEADLEKIQAERAALGQRRASAQSSFSEFDRLNLRHELAQRALASALESLESARARAQSQHLYLERIVEPNLPDYPLYPRRLLWFALVAVTSLIAYGIGWLLVAGIREHTSG